MSAPFFTFTFHSISVEQGQQTELALAVQKGKDFEGAAEVVLLGLPNEVTSPPQQMTKDSTEVVFPLATTANSPPGHHKGLQCRAVVMREGEPITHMLGPGELRIFQPLPEKPAQAAQPAPPLAPQPEKPPEKRLTRLEQLRLDREQAKQAKPPET